MREARFQGISVEEALEQHEQHDEPQAQVPVQVPVERQEGEVQPDAPSANLPKYTRSKPDSDDPAVRYQSAKAGGQWGEGDAGYKPPKSPSDRLKCVFFPVDVCVLLISAVYCRKNVPYKVM